MMSTYRVTQEANASNLNGGGPRFGTNGGPVDSSDDCTVDVGDLTVIVNNEGDWSDVQADDWLVWDTDGVKEHRKVQSVAGANITLTSAVSGAAANKKVRVGGAWKTLGHAADTVVAGDTVYVKGGTPYTDLHGDYGGVMAILTTGDHDAVITFEGYTDTPGDGGQAVLDGQDYAYYTIISMLSGSTYHNYVFRNITCTKSYSHGFDLSNYAIQYENCIAYDNQYSGFDVGAYSNLYDCISYNNLIASGFVIKAYTHVVNCKAYNNSSYGFTCQNAHMLGCLAYGNAYQICMSMIALAGGSIINCTVDGVNQMLEGIWLDDFSTGVHRVMLANNIIVNCSKGIKAVGIDDALVYSRNNLLFNNTTNYDGWTHTTGDITGQDPLFVDAASGDYALQSNSPARNAGWPIFLDLGAEQAESDCVSRLGPTFVM